MSRFCALLRDENHGRSYRQLAGLGPNIPCEATFSNFRERLGASRYNEIFHVLVDIFHQLEMITFNILAHDGTLYLSEPEPLRAGGLYRLNNMAEQNLGSEVRVYVQCPSDRFPEDVKKPKIELLAFKLSFSDGDLTEEQRNTAILFDVDEELERQQLCINTLRSNVTNINFNDGSMTICCPKLLSEP